MESIVPSVLLVLATGVVSLAVAWQQNIFANRRARQEREDALDDRRFELAKERGDQLVAALSQIAQASLDARPERPNRGTYREALAIARDTYLLFPDPEIRRVVANGLTVISSADARNVSPPDFHEAVTTAMFAVAAYLRGERPDEAHVARLAEIRSRYPRSS